MKVFECVYLYFHLCICVFVFVFLFVYFLFVFAKQAADCSSRAGAQQPWTAAAASPCTSCASPALRYETLHICTFAQIYTNGSLQEIVLPARQPVTQLLQISRSLVLLLLGSIFATTTTAQTVLAQLLVLNYSVFSTLFNVKFLDYDSDDSVDMARPGRLGP